MTAPLTTEEVAAPEKMAVCLLASPEKAAKVVSLQATVGTWVAWRASFQNGMPSSSRQVLTTTWIKANLTTYHQWTRQGNKSGKKLLN